VPKYYHSPWIQASLEHGRPAAGGVSSRHHLPEVGVARTVAQKYYRDPV
jgi:hypothetical protein